MKHRRIYYDCIQILIDKTKELPVLYESDAKDSITVYLKNAGINETKKTQQILVNLSGATYVLFTATPFRLDRKEMLGEILYDYPLSKAYENGIFGEIQYVPVESGEDNDLCIAKRAEAVLLNDRKAGYEHYLMVRTDTVGTLIPVRDTRMIPEILKTKNN